MRVSTDVRLVGRGEVSGAGGEWMWGLGGEGGWVWAFFVGGGVGLGCLIREFFAGLGGWRMEGGGWWGGWGGDAEGGGVGREHIIGI